MNYREKCLQHKEGRCVACGSRQDIVVHHVDGDRSNNSIENLETFCQSCHSKIHNSSEQLEEWTERLLPIRDRKFTVRTTFRGDRSRDLQVVMDVSDADSRHDAVREAVKHRADYISHIRPIYGHIDDCRRSPGESDIQVIERALSYYKRMKGQSSPIMRVIDSVKKSRVAPAEIAEILDADELPVAYQTEFSVGGEGE